MDSFFVYGFILCLWIHSILGLWIHSLFMEPYSVYGFIFRKWVHSLILDLFVVVYGCILSLWNYFMDSFLWIHSLFLDSSSDY